jgi:dynein light chain roadblock-type
MDSKQTGQYASLMSGLSNKAKRLIRELDPTNDLTFLRIKSKQCELLISPERDNILIVVQENSLIDSSKT